MISVLNEVRATPSEKHTHDLQVVEVTFNVELNREDLVDFRMADHTTIIHLVAGGWVFPPYRRIRGKLRTI